MVQFVRVTAKKGMNQNRNDETWKSRKNYMSLKKMFKAQELGGGRITKK